MLTLLVAVTTGDGGGVTVPTAYAAAILPAAFLGIVSLIAFLFRQNARSNEALATVAQQLKDIDRRTERLENRVFWGPSTKTSE